MSWRPKDWNNPFKTTVEDVNKLYPNGIPRGYHVLRDAGLNEGVEIGADMMLEAIIKLLKDPLFDKSRFRAVLEGESKPQYTKRR